MVSFKGHFDGKSIVLHEPAKLALGQAVRILLDEQEGQSSNESAKPKFEIRFSPHFDPTAELMGIAIDEQDIIQVDVLEKVPPDFVRKPGSAAGTIKIATDFEETPKAFEDYT